MCVNELISRSSTVPKNLTDCISQMSFLFAGPITECVEGQGIDSIGECIPCRASDGRVLDARGRCVCDASRGYVPRGDTCEPRGCRADAQCDDRERCINGMCVDACRAEPCGTSATCEAVGHRSHCTCIAGYTGNPRVHCNTTNPDGYRTDFPVPDMQVKIIKSRFCAGLTFVFNLCLIL